MATPETRRLLRAMLPALRPVLHVLALAYPAPRSRPPCGARRGHLDCRRSVHPPAEPHSTGAYTWADELQPAPLRVLARGQGERMAWAVLEIERGGD